MGFSATFSYIVQDMYTAKVESMKRTNQRFKTSLSANNKSIDKFSSKMGRMSTRLANLRTGFAAMMLARGLKSVVSTSIDFEKAMNKVEAVTSANQTQMASLRKEARRLGLTTKFSSIEAAKGIAMLGQRGFKTFEILKLIPEVLTMATAGEIDMAEASKMLTGTMRAFELDIGQAAHIADVYAITAANTASAMGDLNGAMINAAPLAHAAGISFEEVAALVGAMSDKNIMGSKSGTLLMNAFRNLVKPTREAVKVLKKFGFKKDEVTDASGQIVDFTRLLELFTERGLGVGEIFKIFQVRGAKGTAALLSQTKVVRRLIKAYEKQSGAATLMSKIMTKGVVEAAFEAQSAWAGMSERIGKSSEDTTINILEIVKAFAEFVATRPELAKHTGTFMMISAALLTVATMAGVVWAVTSGLTLAFKPLIVMVGALGKAIGVGLSIPMLLGYAAAFGVIFINIKRFGVDAIAGIVAQFNMLKIAVESLFTGNFGRIGALLKGVSSYFGFQDVPHPLSSTMTRPDDLSDKQRWAKIITEITGSIDVNDRTGGSVSVGGGGGVVPINVRSDSGYGYNKD